MTLKAGELQGVSHTMTEPLRKLGLPVDLQKGLVVLTRDHDVVKEGDVMTSEQARLLVRRGIFATHYGSSRATQQQQPNLLTTVAYPVGVALVWVVVQKHFDIKMAEFQIDPVAWWADGKFTEMPRDSDDDDEDDIDSN